MVISQKCNCCVHEPVCGFKEEYLYACDAVKKAAYITGSAKNGIVFMKDSAVSVSIKCPHIMLKEAEVRRRET